MRGLKDLSPTQPNACSPEGIQGSAWAEPEVPEFTERDRISFSFLDDGRMFVRR